MDRSLLENIAPFLAVAEHLSFTRAAAALGVTPTAVSKSIRTLERRHGVVLFQRTTRSVALTEAGAALFKRLRHTTAEIGDAFTALSDFRDHPSGVLRLTFSRLVMGILIEPLLAEFREKCPEVTLDLSLDEGTVDIVSGNFDAGIRLGESVEKDLVAVRLTPQITWSIVGSPDYFARVGRPRTPENLTEHEAIMYRFVTSGLLHKWEFKRRGRQFTVEMLSRLIVNDRASLITLARKGLGLAYVADVEAATDLAAGTLEPVLRDFIASDSGLYLYFPARTQSQPKLRAFIDIATRVSSRPGFLDLLRGHPKSGLR
jgi:DNA-binding transcriptional LysR family regulator